MVFRLFVPPGEEQHRLVPKRPDPLGANATLQYSVLGSTVAAAAYTSLATRYGHRAAPAYAAPRPALLIRSSAKLGLWAGVLGATANWYYHSRFTSLVLSQKNDAVKPWKLYERTESLGVDDGCLVGAGVGLAASVPTLFMRRLLVIPRWTCCLGLANIGACAGIVGVYGYLQYTGERQKARVRLERQLKRRTLEFWDLFWDKKTMAQFNPLIQLYIRHNAFWYSQQSPDTASEHAEEHASDAPDLRESNVYVSTSDDNSVHEDQSYYIPPFDYADDLKHIGVEATYAKIEEHEVEIAALLKEAEFILFISARRQYEYCHLKDADDEERRQRLEELQLLQITYNKIRSAAEQLQSRLINWRMSLQHKAILDASTPADSSLAAWLPKTAHDFSKHNPALSLQELERTQAAIDAEVRSFEAGIAYPGYAKAKKDRWRLDLEDGRSLLRVADKLVWELEKMQDAARKESTRKMEAAETSRGVGTATPKPSSESLEPGKS
ncbi:uncharacterized protein EKO05_0004921 [Ascochyta rabiei]|uniref:Uncharacterized protein n=1 Tax=Didymella rabiei TaxID=5454 RepID=A0A163D658_DIDRA|nr:uncharacterized protein EKO05_0004921 [Ascochyta rabiei]KZM22939.1 hypothetical protein ST47_g5936 [Ascochyta rabiei]UPX14441.1 hypothetical protein EKO05_0004921 [Ascochyta rabiei]